MKDVLKHGSQNLDMSEDAQRWRRVHTYGGKLHENLMQYATYILPPDSVLQVQPRLLSEAEAQASLDEFRRVYPNLAAWMDMDRMVATSLGWIHPQTVRQFQIEQEIEEFEKWQNTPDPEENRIRQEIVRRILGWDAETI